MLTVVSNTFNEEFLIRPWLLHHREMFDHGIIIDYGSTDRTADIIRELTPTWEIRSPKAGPFVGNCKIIKAAHPHFPTLITEVTSDYPGWNPHICTGNDKDVMLIEAEVSGWKMCLNTSEFLFHENLRVFLESMEKQFPMRLGIRTNGVVMVDCPEHRSQYDSGNPLLQQKTHGYYETALISGLPLAPHQLEKVTHMSRFVEGRSRLIHRARHGHYGPGRHCASVPNVFPRSHGLCPESPILLCWFAYSPFDQIRDRPGSRLAWVSVEERENRWRQEVALAVDLLNIPAYAAVYNYFKEVIWK